MRLLRIFTQLVPGLMMLLASSSPIQAGVVTIWGEEPTPTPGVKNKINNFYNSLAKHVSSIAAGELNTVNLANTDLLWVTTPADAYTSAELNAMASFIAGGGRIAFMGEHGAFTLDENNRMNTALAFLGCSISITVYSQDGNSLASVANGQILKHPLTEGVTAFEYNAFAPLTVSGTAQVLMRSRDSLYIMMAYQSIGAGSVFVIADQNVWDNSPVWPSADNERLFENLLTVKMSVNGPMTNPVYVTDLNSSTPTIHWTYFDVEGDVQQQYQVEVWTAPNGAGMKYWGPPVGTGTATSAVYAGIPLRVGGVCYARVRAADASGWGEFSEISFSLEKNARLTHPLLPLVTEKGYISLSLDALGTAGASGGAIQVNKPKNATVRSAYLVGATTMDGMKLVEGDVSLDGSGVVWQQSVVTSIPSWNQWADVTSLVKPKIDASAPGIINLSIDEKDTGNINGVILAVIFDDPNQTRRNTVILFFGAQDMSGDDFYIRYSEPIDLKIPNLHLDFSLGISFSYQSASIKDSKQYSIIDVNGKRLTTSAGGQDDGYTITVGGIGDSNDNPADPNAMPDSCRDDDELYSLIPFVAQGDNQTHIYTKNSTIPDLLSEDNICFAALFTSATSFVGEEISLTPVADTNLLGALDTLNATVQNALGAPVTGRKVIFEILNGPHAGLKDTSVTNSSGKVVFIYTGKSVGVDEIKAIMADTSGALISSNRAYHYWETSSKSAPVADAGPDQTIPAGAFGDTAITLDGTKSYDPNGGSIVSYLWLIPSATTITGARPTIRLPKGIHQIILTVVDDENSTDNDTVIITVTDTTHTAIPVIKHAAFFADNGRGSVDRVEIYYNGPLKTTQIPDSIRICWPDSSDCRMVRKASIALDKSDSAHVTITIPAPAFPDGITAYAGPNGSLGRSYWKDPSAPDSPTAESPFAIADSVGPLIAAASVLERIKKAVDTLYVSFSEAIRPQSLIGASLILIKNGVPSVILVDTFRQLPSGYYVLSLDTGSAQPLPGDSLRINPQGPLRDQFGNPAHALNRPVLLGTKGIPPSILWAYYFDRDSGKADGVVDEAIIKFDRKAQIDSLSLLFDWGSSLSLSTIQGTDVAYCSADSTLISVNLKNAFFGRPFPKTSGVMYVTSQWKQWKKVPWQTDHAQVQDSAGPVISSASYLFNGEVGNACDTLVVFFSEPVTIRPDQNAMPFKFLNISNGSTYMLSVTLIKPQSNDTMARFCVNSDPMTAIPKTGDSIWINLAGGVSDTEGIAQLNERNRRVAFKVSQPNSELAVKVLRNPFTPGTVVPNTDLIGTAAVIVTVNPKAKLQDLTGDYKIYDLLGNLVFEGKTFRKDLPWPINTCYCFAWEGRNRAHRIVASGTYHMAIKYAVEGEMPKEAWIRIGVKR